MEILSYIIGALVGSIVTIIFQRAFTKVGTIKIDRTNPAKDVYRLEVDDLDSLPRKKYILLKVDAKADLSQN